MKTVLYTGARSGLSSYVINKLLKKDYLIYVTVHTEEEEKYIKKRYKNESKIICFKLDITSSEDLEKLKLLNIDVLVCNAAIGEGGSLVEMDVNRIRNNFEVNVFSTFRLIQIILRNMIKRKTGRVIVISSLASTIPLCFLGSYCGSKASLSMMTRILKKEVEKLNKKLDIILIEPGLYHTGFNQVMLDNKYDKMSVDSFFKEQLEIIKRRENMLFGLFEKKDYASIGNKIYRAIDSKYPRFIYRAPLLQSITAKIYKFLT